MSCEDYINALKYKCSSHDIISKNMFFINRL